MKDSVGPTSHGRRQLRWALRHRRWRSAVACACACAALGLPLPGLAAPATPAVPPPDTGPDSLACQTAMKELRAQERAAASAPLPGGTPRGVNERLQAPRARAARACLGNEATEGAAAAGGPAPLVEPQPPASVGPAAAAAAARGASAATEAARAASAASAAAPRRGGTAVPPVAVPPVRPALPVPATPRAAAPPLPAPALPKTVTGCDAAGCWASDGTRLQRQGALLVGPRGACTQQGGVLACP